MSNANYYPFGMAMSNRNGSVESYRYSFQGQEKDDEIKGEGNSLNYKYRMHDPRVGRFFAVDPLAPKYPHNSPYAFSENRVIDGIELEGLEYLDADNTNIDCQQDNGDGTYSVTLGETEFTGISRVTINGSDFYDLGQHMYHNDDGWSTTGTRHEQATDETKVGIQLISNIGNLPKVPDDYTEPPMWTNPELSWAVANKYQNCRGMCYAVSMARVNQAFSDQGVNDAISLNTQTIDYRISRTSSKAPLAYKGYGVGGAIANNGYGILINNAGVWDGDLQKGAALQYWEHTSFTSALQNGFNGGGHSIIFDNYNFDNNGNIIGFNYTDYNGTGRVVNYNNGIATTSNATRIIVVGANLIDP